MSESNENKPLSLEEIREIFAVVAEAYAAAGKGIKTAEVHIGDKVEILVDNRTQEDIDEEAAEAAKQLFGG